MDQFFNADDLSDVLAQLDAMEDVETKQTEEELASQKRYEEIIKKHKNEE